MSHVRGAGERVKPVTSTRQAETATLNVSRVDLREVSDDIGTGGNAVADVERVRVLDVGPEGAFPLPAEVRRLGVDVPVAVHVADDPAVHLHTGTWVDAPPATVAPPATFATAELVVVEGDRSPDP